MRNPKEPAYVKGNWLTAEERHQERMRHEQRTGKQEDLELVEENSFQSLDLGLYST